jgi:hypothetical protein
MRASALCVAGLGVGLAIWPAWAHHELSAEFDDKKPVTLKGVVTRYEWNNPHVYFFVDVESGGAVVNWALESLSPDELRKDGWTRESLKVGDSVTVEANRARDGSNLGYAKTVTVAGGKKLTSPANEALGTVQRSQGKPTPRWPDGHPRLGAPPGEKGYWVDVNAGGLYESSAGTIRMNSNGLLANIADSSKVAPFQPWAKGLYEYRQKTLLKDDPMVSCLPPGGPRLFQDPHGFAFLDQPDRKRVFVLSAGGNRNWRLIDMDGRALPNVEDASPTYFGYSSGKWDGDTLVVNSLGYAERFWFTNGGLPHSENLKLTERISRPDFNTLKYEVTVDDAGAYTRPWTGGWTLQWVPNQEIEQYFCQDNPRDDTHMVGK